MTDTPETDGEWNRLACQDHPEFERNLADFARKLERERDEARGQLAGIENKMRGELGGHPDSELWGDAGLIAATMRCVDAIGEVTDQRDEWKAKYIQQNKDLGCEQMDPNGTIWDYAKKLQAKRDELLAAIRNLRDVKGRFHTEQAAINLFNLLP